MVYDETGEIEVHLALKSFKPLNNLKQEVGMKKIFILFFFFNFFLAELDLCCRTQTLSSCGGQRPLPRFGAPALLLADHGL